MEENYDNTTNITGPSCAFRLEGKVNEVKKIIYLFGEIHYTKNTCADLINLNFNQYLIREFNKVNNEKNRKVDFFLEFSAHTFHRLKERLLFDEQDIMYNLYKFFFKNIKNEITISTYGKNVRLHYGDIRLENIVQFSDLLKKLKKFTDLDKESQKSILNDKDNKINFFDERIINTEVAFKFIINIINKIFYKYENEEIRKKLEKYFDIFKKELDNFIKVIDKNKKTNPKTKFTPFFYYDVEIPTYEDFENYKLENYYEQIFSNYFVLLTDLYTIRRILDKKYITNSICYFGRRHTFSMIYILVKEFNFEITNSYFHISPENIKELINTNDYIEFIYKIFKKLHNFDFDNIDNFYNCVKLDKFPTSFN